MFFFIVEDRKNYDAAWNLDWRRIKYEFVQIEYVLTFWHVIHYETSKQISDVDFIKRMVWKRVIQLSKCVQTSSKRSIVDPFYQGKASSFILNTFEN